MDFIQKGKQLAQDGKYDEALDALVLALENDKENPDIHFYLGLCYSSLEEFGYAKYHYQMALSLNPQHGKTKLVWEGIKDVTPQKPPEKRITRSAAQKALKEQEVVPEPKADPAPPLMPEPEIESPLKKYKVTDDKWEKAFPSDLAASSRSSLPMTLLYALIGIAIIGALVYYALMNGLL
ncbi:MAG: tetratricopeptide repeat protein [bacterium]|jgi:tetratricopeptide (TPR) repeat protein|nr:tetratricopeptide repeat protein [bacterium]